jgi:hypothetical protein
MTSLANNQRSMESFCLCLDLRKRLDTDTDSDIDYVEEVV